METELGFPNALFLSWWVFMVACPGSVAWMHDGSDYGTDFGINWRAPYRRWSREECGIKTGRLPVQMIRRLKPLK